MILHIREAIEAEKLYFEQQPYTLNRTTGQIGVLKADISKAGGFCPVWMPITPEFITDSFTEDFEKTIIQLRFGNLSDIHSCIYQEDNICFLKDKTKLIRWCLNHKKGMLNQDRPEVYGFRVDSNEYVYMMRIELDSDLYNLYCFCYKRNVLDAHLMNSSNGIELYANEYSSKKIRIPDGGRVQICYPNGEVKRTHCRFIDAQHVQIGLGEMNLFHVYELAELQYKYHIIIDPIDLIKETP